MALVEGSLARRLQQEITQAPIEGLALGRRLMTHRILGPMPLYYYFAFVGAHEAEARHAVQIREANETLSARTTIGGGAPLRISYQELRVVT